MRNLIQPLVEPALNARLIAQYEEIRTIPSAFKLLEVVFPNDDHVSVLRRGAWEKARGDQIGLNQIGSNNLPRRTDIQESPTFLSRLAERQ
ncbi:hypothetical protein D3C87_1458030 [compost metagenome]